MRWLFHVVPAADVSWESDGRYRAASLDAEGFIHASYRERVLESAALYFPEGADLRVLAIDPRRLDVPIDVVATPRGPMPHVRGSIPCDAIRVLRLEEVSDHPDRVTGTRIGFVAFEGMTLLDLVGPLDVLSRIGSMGFDPTASCEVIALTRPNDDPTVSETLVWRGSGMSAIAGRYRPALDAFDVLVVAGGPSTRTIARADPTVVPYLASFPHNRLVASVCTGALLLGEAGRLEGKRATTHASAMHELARFGAIAVKERVVEDGNIVTAAGVTAGIDLGLHLVLRLEGREVKDAIADRIESQRST
jgi:cyclohexyl-isocyanide hydratase